VEDATERELRKLRAEAVLRTVASLLRTTVTADSPLLEGRLPGGERFMGVLPPAVVTLEQYVAADIMTSGQRDAIVTAVADHRNRPLGIAPYKAEPLRILRVERAPDRRILVVTECWSEATP
jgi:hypothetical protein